jgi:RNA recognition motif. (a.k.a. RRM, RBD, or RNP domain)
LQTDKDELVKFFESQNGFKLLHIPSRDFKKPTFFAFVEFIDVASAKEVHDKHQVGPTCCM